MRTALARRNARDAVLADEAGKDIWEGRQAACCDAQGGGGPGGVAGRVGWRAGWDGGPLGDRVRWRAGSVGGPGGGGGGGGGW